MSGLNNPQRVLKDLQDFSKVDGFSLEYDEKDISDLRVTFSGPRESPFEGGEFKIHMKVPSKFPFSRPKVNFITRVFHPNISSASGAVCMNLLSEWSPATSLIEVAEACQALLSQPNPNSPLSDTATILLRKNPKLYEMTAQYWTAVHAKGTCKPENLSDIVHHVQEVKNCSEEQALLRVTYALWDVESVLSGN